jgi:5'-3' exonuclease
MRLHVVDGTFELYRAHFAKRPDHVLKDGTNVKATVGVMSSLLTLLQDTSEEVTHVAVAYDNPIVSFRNGLFDGYKTDEGVPPELRAQFDLVEDATRALGITVWSMDEFEADDAMGSAAARFKDQVDEVRILSPDKDMGQCLVQGRVVMVDRIRNKVVDEAAFTANRGIKPAQVPDWLALTGDTADGIPGLDGFGDKTAVALLAAFGRLEDIPAQPSAWPTSVRGAARLSVVLKADRDAAMLYRKLATLRTDAPISKTLEELRWQGVPRDAYAQMLQRLELETTRPAPHRFAGA